MIVSNDQPTPDDIAWLIARMSIVDLKRMIDSTRKLGVVVTVSTVTPEPFACDVCGCIMVVQQELTGWKCNNCGNSRGGLL